MAELVSELDKDTINNKVAQDIFLEMAQTGKSPVAIIKDKNLAQIGSSDELEKIVLQIVQNNTNQVKAYLSGNERLFGFFIGQAMKLTQGKANPKILKDLFQKHLK